MTIDPYDLMAQVLRAEVHRFIGRLGGDPELRTFDGGTCVANVRMAVDHPDKKRDDHREPDWFKIEMWGEHAMAFADGFTKGDLVDVTGRIRVERWTDRSTGQERYILVIKAEGIAKLRAATPKPPEGGAPAAPAAAAAPVQWGSAPASAPAAPAAPAVAPRPSPF